jgi:predicted nucleic acid-binding protein
MSEPLFIDTNVPMYAAGQEHAYRLPSQECLRLITSNRVEVVTDVEVHQEILHRYLALGMADKALEVSQDFETLVPNIIPLSMDDIRKARELGQRYPNARGRDLLHLAVMLNHGIKKILSADGHFDSFKEINRIDPLDMASAP